MKLNDINPIKVLLANGNWYVVKPNTFEWVDVIYEEREKDEEVIPMLTVMYAKFRTSDEILFIEASEIKGYSLG